MGADVVLVNIEAQPVSGALGKDACDHGETDETTVLPSSSRPAPQLALLVTERIVERQGTRCRRIQPVPWRVVVSTCQGENRPHHWDLCGSGPKWPFSQIRITERPYRNRGLDPRRT
jgi:hypothetical protein